MLPRTAGSGPAHAPPAPELMRRFIFAAKNHKSLITLALVSLCLDSETDGSARSNKNRELWFR